MINQIQTVFTGRSCKYYNKSVGAQAISLPRKATQRYRSLRVAIKLNLPRKTRKIKRYLLRDAERGREFARDVVKKSINMPEILIKLGLKMTLVGHSFKMGQGRT